MTITLIDQNTLSNYPNFTGAVKQALVYAFVQAMTTPTYPTVEDNKKLKEMGKRLVSGEDTYSRKVARIAISLTNIETSISYTIVDDVITEFDILNEATFKSAVETIWLSLYGVV